MQNLFSHYLQSVCHAELGGIYELIIKWLEVIYIFSHLYLEAKLLGVFKYFYVFNAGK